MKQKKNISHSGLDTWYAGVEAVFLSRETFVCNITLCRKRKGRLEIVLQEQQLDILPAIKILKKAAYIYLLITGKPVIHKKLAKFYENPQALTGVLLPDARPADFVAQCAENNGVFYGAVVRRDVLHQVLKHFTEEKLFPQQVVLGPAILQLITHLLPGENTFSTSAYEVQSEGTSVLFSPSTQQPLMTSMGEDQVHTCNLPALCLCLQAQTNSIVLTAIDDAEVKKSTVEAVQKRRFKKLLVLSVAVLFVVTTANFFANKMYSQQYNRLDEQLALNRQMLQEVEKLEKDISEKKSLLGQRPASSQPVISFIGDRIASTVPAKIRLQNLEIFPVQGKITKEKPIEFAFNKVLVEGISTESDVLDKWITDCRKFKWIKDVQIVKYTFDHEKRKGLFKLEFLLQ